MIYSDNLAEVAMDVRFISNRISMLRTSKDVSEYEMSLSLGFSRNYIQKISSGQSLPSLPSLLRICDFFGITPKEFFDEDSPDPVLVHELYEEMQGFSPDRIKAVIDIIRVMKD